MVLFLGGVVALVGYTLSWDGWLMLRGASGPGRQGPGFLDLILPSRIAKVDLALQSPGTNATSEGSVGSGTGSAKPAPAPAPARAPAAPPGYGPGQGHGPSGSTG